MRLFPVVPLAVLIAAAACPPAAGPGADEPLGAADDPLAADPPASDAPGDADVEGVWLSDGCGPGRGWQRLLSFSADGTYAQQDYVAPCPPDVICVWSGIVLASGNWRLEGNDLILERTTLHPAEGPNADVPVPDLFLHDAGEGWIFAERAADAECPYRRGATTLREP